MLKFVALACLAAIAFGKTNHYIGTVSFGTTTLYFPYPVDQCCLSTYTGSTNYYSKYTCTNSTSITKKVYSDSTCSTAVGTSTVYTTSTTAGLLNSWVCSGDSSYAEITGYLTSACSGTSITSYYATNVCYNTAAGNYSSATCDSDSVTVSTYSSSDSTCTGTLLGDATDITTCTKFGSLYATFADCQADSAFIPSLMAIVALLVFNIAYLL